MDKIRIKGGVPLEGVIPIGGAKNAALPLMAASLLTAETLTLENVPDLADIATMANLLVQHGVGRCRARRVPRPARSNSRRAHITSTTAPYDLVRKMRASVLVLGPLVARCGRGAGVAAGRLRDRHPAGRSSHQGAAAARRRGRPCAKAISTRARPRGCRGAEIVFPAVSVGATENLLMAADAGRGRDRC